MRIAIIGCGYVGTTAGLLWLKQHHEITATTTTVNRCTELAELGFIPKLFHSDSPEVLAEVLEGKEVALFCMAAKQSQDYARTYLKTAQCLERTLPQLNSVKHIFYTSSTSVYGEHKGQIVDEESPLKPKSSQAQILIDTEQSFLRCTHFNKKVCILRLSEIIGPQRDPLERIKRYPERPLPGTGNNPTHLIHVEDITLFLNFCLEKDLEGIFNLVNDVRLSRKDFIETLARKNSLPKPQWNGIANSIHGSNKIVSNNKVKQLGFQFKHPLYPIEMA